MLNPPRMAYWALAYEIWFGIYLCVCKGALPVKDNLDPYREYLWTLKGSSRNLFMHYGQTCSIGLAGENFTIGPCNRGLPSIKGLHWWLLHELCDQLWSDELCLFCTILWKIWTFWNLCRVDGLRWDHSVILPQVVQQFKEYSIVIQTQQQQAHH